MFNKSKPFDNGPSSGMGIPPAPEPTPAATPSRPLTLKRILRDIPTFLLFTTSALAPLAPAAPEGSRCEEQSAPDPGGQCRPRQGRHPREGPTGEGQKRHR